MRSRPLDSIVERTGRGHVASRRAAVGTWLLKLAWQLGRFASANTVLVLSLVIGAGLVTALTAASAEVYDAVEDGDGIAAFDRPTLDTSISLRTATTVSVVTAFTHLGGPLWMTVIASAITVALTLAWRSKTPLILMLVGVAGSLTMTNVGKTLVGRVRPPLADAVPPYESSPSFPSGHTLNSTVIAGVIAYLLLRKVTSTWLRALTITSAIAWAGLMGLSRVFLGHHWLTDVAVGWTLGLAWVATVITAHRLYVAIVSTAPAGAAAGRTSVST